VSTPIGFHPAVAGGGARLRRRELLIRAAQLGVALPAGSVLGAACGGGSSGASSAPPTSQAITGTPVVLNYAGWMGKDIVKNFEAKYPGASIKQIPEASISNGAVVPAIKANLSTYDAALGDQAVVGQAIAAGVLQPLDWSKIPNIANVDSHFRNAYSHGAVSDYGKTGIAYRSDLVKENITSWADFWRLAPKYSGKIVCMDFDRDVIGSALKYKGHSTNTTSESDLNDALQAMLQLKPHLQAIKSYDVGAGLAKGTTLMAMDWDYDTALVQQENSNVKWVLPEEGATAYLEGFFAVKDTPDLATLEAFFNFFLDPRQYADFVNTVNAAYVMSAAKPYIKKWISESPTLSFDAATLAKVEFESYVGDAIALYAKVWDEFKSA
jgi:spermidine/putrescine transport system substrate-binding protein